MKLPVDHVGVLTRSLPDTVKAWRALGFTVSEPARLETGGGPARQDSAHVIFEHGYIELTAVSGDDPAHHLARWRGAPPGARLLLLRTGDAEREAARLRAAGLDAGPVHDASRRLTYGDGGRVRFRWFGVEGTGIPGTLTAYVEHRDAERVFDPGAARHENTARDLLALHVRPAEVAAALVTADGPGDVECRPDGPAAEGDAPWIADIEIAVRDAAAARRAAEQGGVTHQAFPGGLAVGPAVAGGVGLKLLEVA